MSNTMQTTIIKNIATKFSNKDPRQRVYCFDCKMTLRIITSDNGVVLPFFDYGVAIKLEIIYTGKVS